MHWLFVKDLIIFHSGNSLGRARISLGDNCRGIGVFLGVWCLLRCGLLLFWEYFQIALKVVIAVGVDEYCEVKMEGEEGEE